MALTPEDVRTSSSRPSLREGYDEDEVDAFLDEVEAELARLLRENDELRRAWPRSGAPQPRRLQAAPRRRPPPPVAPAAPAPPPVAPMAARWLPLPPSSPPRRAHAPARPAHRRRARRPVPRRGRGIVAEAARAGPAAEREAPSRGPRSRPGSRSCAPSSASTARG